MIYEFLPDFVTVIYSFLLRVFLVQHGYALKDHEGRTLSYIFHFLRGSNFEILVTKITFFIFGAELVLPHPLCNFKNTLYRN